MAKRILAHKNAKRFKRKEKKKTELKNSAVRKMKATMIC